MMSYQEHEEQEQELSTARNIDEEQREQRERVIYAHHLIYKRRLTNPCHARHVRLISLAHQEPV
jgi:hypothetical protein